MTRADPGPLRVRFGEFELDEANALLSRGGRAIDLAPTPFGLLCALVRHPGALLSKHVLLDAVWGHRFVSNSVLKTAISDLRSVLGDDAREPRFIETVARRGYRFIAKPAAPAVEAASSADAVESEHSGSMAFVGRAEELARLQRAWGRASHGKRAVVWVVGAPGVGKTTLIQRFLSEHRDAACARGYCVEHYGSGEPYLPVLEALAQQCRIDETLPILLRIVAPTWLLQMPWLGTVEERESLRRELAGVSPERMLREMGELLDRYTEQRPLLLITEDLHWSDRATIQLIDYVARRRSSARLMWLASFRLAEVVASEHPLNSLRHELRLHGLCEEIVLDPFSESEVAAYLTGRSSSLGSNEGFVRALHARTDGVPLFLASVIEDVLKRAAENGAGASGEDLARLAVPENVAAIIDRYVLKLSAERRALLSAAAVCGVEFRIGSLARVLGRDADEIADACDQLKREQLWLAAPGKQHAGDAREASARFRHAVFREVLYERMPPSARAELHRKVGRALEQERSAGRAVTASELAMHFDRGRAPTEALRFYAEAAEAALLHLSPHECMSLTERALCLLDQAPPDTERTALEISLATLRGEAAFHVLGSGDEARMAFQRASSLLHHVPRHSMRGLLVQGFGLVLCMRAEYDEALATANRADALASQTDDSTLALAAGTVRGQVLMLQGRPREARESLERVIPPFESPGGDAERSFGADPQVMLLAVLSLQLAHLGLLRQARERLRQAYARARALGQPVALMVAIWLDMMVEVRIGDASRVAALADEMRALVEEADLAQGRMAWRWFRGWAEARKGNALEGYRQIRDACEGDKATGRIAGDSENLGYAAEALVLHGDWQAAQGLLERALGLVRMYGERIYLPQLLLIEGAIAGARGDPGAAEAAVRRAVVEAREQGAAWLELLALTALCERAGAADEDRRALAALVDALPEASETIAIARARTLLDPIDRTATVP